MIERNLIFAVITKTDERDVASAFMYKDTVVDVSWGKNMELVKELKHIKAPVFVEGEIIILDADSLREIDGHQRKPDKWLVEYETYEDLDEAIERSVELFESHLKEAL